MRFCVSATTARMANREMTETSPDTQPGPESDPAAEFDFRAMLGQLAELLSKQIFFIGGSIGSGTTWLQVLLDRHPEISCRGEGHFVTHLVGSLKQAVEEHNRYVIHKNSIIYRDLDGYPLFDTPEFNFLHATAMLLLLLKQSTGKSPLAIGEKTPDNVRIFEGLRVAFPAAKFIQMVRDPRDAAVSGWYLGQRTSPELMTAKFADMVRYLRHFADVWALEVACGVEFGSRHPEQYIEVRYADLVEHPEAALEPVLRFLGVDSSLENLKACVDAATFERLSRGRPPGVEDRRSHFRRGVVGDWVNHLDAETNDYFMATAGDLMKRLGLD